MKPEVRYHMLRPEQIVERRKACSVAYIPIGTLEWHGLHAPVGLDTLQAEGLAILAAQKGGGLVFPSLYYGENRLESLMDANAADREQIAAGMDLSPENFSPEHFPFTAMAQTLNYQKLLIHILGEVQTLGFKLGVLLAGHYPLIDHACAAVQLFNRRRYDQTQRYSMVAWAAMGYMLVEDKYDSTGGHADGWETSHMLALHPETVDLSRLPPRGEKPVGVDPRIPPQDATAEFGREILEAATEILVKEVQHRLANPDLYHSHGRCLDEGLWREEGQ